MAIPDTTALRLQKNKYLNDAKSRKPEPELEQVCEKI